MKDSNTTLSSDATVNDVILRYPATVGVFKAFGIDSCCGGGLTIAEAAKRHGCETQVVMDMLLEAAFQKPAA